MATRGRRSGKAGELKVFISWSGLRSKAVAAAINDWLPEVIEGVRPWVSTHDIAAGTRWNAEIDRELSDTHFGILCLTPENIHAPWILFEAGALAKVVEVARVVPYRLGLSASDVEPPLSQFNNVAADEAGTLDLLRSLNQATNEKYDQGRLEKRFATWWPSLKMSLDAIPPGQKAQPSRQDRDLLEELLELTRRQSHREDDLNLRLEHLSSEFLLNFNMFRGEVLYQMAVSRSRLPLAGYDLLDYIGLLDLEQAKKMKTGSLFAYWLSINEWLSQNDTPDVDADEFYLKEQLFGDIKRELATRGVFGRHRKAEDSSLPLFELGASSIRGV